MPNTRVTITLDEEMVSQLDKLVKHGVFASRSKAIQVALEEKLSQIQKVRLSRDYLKLDQVFDKDITERRRRSTDDDWPF